ncbi:hypothetical protein LshimejAT787_0505380 [Lyophyllum shimeji]|uniref:Cysteine-rich transmembrane CYSTM domain-containing protein n=1 Tax=Lyophyllum shimeji TaxID=47721 RepID=A0A9P3PNH0_LYOSH|nr:hypothetical protein LshimejAT787_0505380 [Lyophyllum shimeji]
MSARSEQPIAVPAVAKTAPVTAQPKAESMKMETLSSQHDPESCSHNHNKARRLRGGGAAKDCFLGMIGCFLCFECCEGCCDCVGDIICCPCEMCC